MNLVPVPEGYRRYTKGEAKANGLCDNCIHWKGNKKIFSCTIITVPDGMCGRIKEVKDHGGM